MTLPRTDGSDRAIEAAAAAIYNRQSRWEVVRGWPLWLEVPEKTREQYRVAAREAIAAYEASA
jgi:hypothetical protein